MPKTLMLITLWGLLLAGCTSQEVKTSPSTATRLPTTTLAQIVTSTLKPSATPTITPEPTETSTPTPTSTSTPSASEILATMGRIAFASDREGQFDIYTILANGEGLERLTMNMGNNQQPKWSPDGGSIAFSSDRNGNWDIFIMQADGSAQTLLAGTPADESNPVWSKNGDQIAYISEQKGVLSIVFVDLAGNVIDRFAPETEITEICCLTWDTEGILHFSFRRGDGWPLTLVLWMLERDEFMVVEPNNAACCLSWQPGYTGGYAVSIGVPGGWQIFQNAILEDPKPLVTDSGNNLNPTWSPWHKHGQWLAYTTDKGGNTDIYLVEVNSLEITPLVIHPAEDIQPDWQKK